MKKNYILLLFLLISTLSLHAQLQYAICFDGVNDFAPVYRTTETGIFGTNANNDSFTIEFWAKDNGNGGKHLYSKHYDSGTNKEGYFIEKSPAGTITVGIANTSNTWSTITGVRVINDGNWHHIAYTFDFNANIISLYVDGVPDGSLSGFTAVFGNNVDARLASSEYENTYFGGAFDEVKIWNTVKTAFEINNSKDASLNTSSLPSDLILYYQCNEGIPDNDNWILYQLVDHTGNGRPGDLWNVFRLGPCSNWVHSVPSSALIPGPGALASSLPADNATNIATNSNIVLTFNTHITFGTGNIEVIDVTDGSSSLIIDVTSPGSQASISANVLTINPNSDLEISTNYAVKIAATAIDDTNGNSYAGITNNTLLDFTTLAPDLTPPVFENSTPSSSSITETTFTLETDIDQAGTIYYVAVADGATAPTSAEVKAGTASGGGSVITSGNTTVSTGGFTNDFSVAGLTDGTAYDVYVVAEDDETTPNLQVNPTKIDVSTIALPPLASIVITEIMYNPAEAGNDLTEYIELYNAGSSAVDLTGYSFSQGVAHTFTGGSINAGEYFVITVNMTELDNRYGAGTADAQWTGGLSNGGEDIELKDAFSRVVDYVDYDDGSPWPTGTDGDGASLRLCDVTSDNSLAANWSASDEATGVIINTHEVKGTPGQAAFCDTTAPVFENSTPSSASIDRTSFTLNTDIDEAGTIYYVVVADGATAPTSTEVKAGTASGGGTTITSENSVVTTGSFTNAFNVTGLTVATAYDVYVVAEDDTATPNLQTSPTKIDVTTAANIAPTFTSTAITTVNEGDTYTYTITTNDLDGDNVTVTAPTKPSWLSLTTTPGGEVTTLAGSGTIGSTDANGTSASFKYPYGVAVDGSGNVYVADESNHKIRKIAPNGDVTTFAGSGSQGSTDANGTAASFRGPYGVAVDGSGNVYVADQNNHKIRKIAPNGDVTTLAGSGSTGSTDANGTAASFNTPLGVAVDGSGNVYVADYRNHKIRKIAPNGDVTTLAGSGSTGSTDANGTAASFSNPSGVAVGGLGNVYVADRFNHKIRKIAPNGDVTTLAGSGSTGSTDANGTAASFNFPSGVAVDGSGNVYVAEMGNHKIRKIAPNGDVTTLAGSGSTGSTDANGTAASFNAPSGVAVDGSGNVYVADQSNNKIRKISEPPTTLTGDSTGKVGDHPVVLEANDGNGGTVQQPFTITVNDATAPVFENSTPSASSITSTRFTLNIDIDEAGTIYYIILNDGDPTVPTSASVKAGSGFLVDRGNATVSAGSNDLIITGLGAGHTYNVYVVAEDDEGTPNLQANPTKIDVTLKEVLISFDAVSNSGLESVATVNIPVNLETVSGETITVDYAVTGTATGSGTDYTLANGTLTFNTGSTSEDITIASIVDDNILEANETIIITLSNPSSNASLGTSTIHTYTITNNDNAAVTIEDVTVDEDAGNAILTATLDNPVQGGFTVDVSTADGTATIGDSDYGSVTAQTLTFAGTVGETQTFTVTSTNDTKVEADETFTITQSNLAGTSLSVDITDGATGTINNDDTASVTIADVLVNEGDGGTIMTLTLDNAVQGGFNVDVSTLDGTATAADVDYATIVSQTVTFAGTAGETQIVLVAIGGNSIAESTEVFTLFMNNLTPTSASSTAINITDSGTITILDDDSGSLAVNDVTMAENADGATTDFTFTVTFTGQIDTGFTVDYGTGDNTAIGGTDYVAKTGQLNFVGTPNETQTFTVTVNNDDIVETNETFGVQLSNVQASGRNVTISDGDGIGTITNDDSTAVTISDVSGNENDGDIIVTATLDNAVQGGFTVDVNTLDVTATVADSDYTAVTGQTITFTGTAGETQTFTVTPTSDNKVEADEIVTIGMTTVDNTPSFDDISITDIATLTILNDDSATVTLVGDITIDEDAGNAILTATLDNAVQGGFFIHITTSDGTAVSTTDYTASNDEANTDFSGTAGETQSIFVSITDDMIGEPTESFTVTLSSVSGTTLGTSITTVDAATVTINDNDAPVITTTAASSVTQLSATLGGDVTNAGGATVLDRGVVYAITSTNNDPVIGGTGVTQDTNGTGIGVFSESITGLQPDTQYSFKAYATNTSGTGYGAVMTFTTPALIAPSITFADVMSTFGDADFNLAATSNSSGTISYSIIAGGTGSASLSGANNGTVSLADAGTVTIRATQVADGIYTAGTQDMTLTIGKATLTVTADNKTKEYGDANPSLTISYAGFKGSDDASVLDTAPTASTAATMTSDVGTPSITVSGGADNNYDFSYVSGTLTITQATLTATADDQSKVYGDANPSFTITYSGFKGSDDASVLDTTPTATSTAVDNTSIGTVDITVSGGSDNNYTINNVNGTLTITQRPITVIADDKTKERTTADPVFTYMITSGDLVNGDAFTGDLTRDAGEDVGTYAINQGALSAGANYNVTFVPGTLTIEDTIAPNTPTLTHVSDYTCSGTDITGDTTLEISGTAEEGSEVEVFENGTSIGVTTTSSNGTFTFDHTGTTLADGTYNFTVTATDASNNTSALSAPLTITINSLDTDGDGIPDVCDDDYDGNGVDDTDEDCDNDGIVDHLDTDSSSCAAAIQEVKSYGFSPNGDGVNDGWYIENITAYPNSVVQVYSRSGKLVFKKKGYQNDWEGVSNQISNNGSGTRLPVGPYLFIIDLGDGSKPTRGWIYVNY